jgi:phosphoribosyl-ATP pyrophosphohydrolase
VIRNTDKNEEKVLSAVKACANTYRIKSRNYTKNSTDYVIELSVNDPQALAEKLGEAGVEKFSVIEYDSEDIL